MRGQRTAVASSGVDRRTRPRLGLSFAPPDAPAAAIHRHRLVHLLDIASQQRLTVIVAPPGYGKTTLLAQWAARDHQPRVRWLTVSPRHNYQAHFAADLGRVFEEIEDLPPTTLVLDDFHLLSNSPLLDECAALIEGAPRSVHVVLAGRADPPLRYYRFRLSEGLFELRQEQLAFTPEEAAELIRRLAGRPASAAHVNELVERTEGWAMALQLAALAHAQPADVGDFVEAFSDDDRNTAEYLREQVLRHQPPETRRFLLETSVLEAMNGPLCDFVTEQHRSQAMLEDLDRTSTFVVTSDPGNDSFRYHRLFRNVLRQQLHDEDPTHESVLLHRAAEWYLSGSDVANAVHYLAQAECWDEVLETAATHAADMFSRHRAAEVAGWIERVPPDVRQGRIPVLLLDAAARLFGGTAAGVREILDAVDATPGASSADRTVANLLRGFCALAQGSMTEAVRSATLVVEPVERLDESALPNVLGLTGRRRDVAAAGFVARGVALTYQGRFAEADRDLSSVTEQAHGVWRTYALGSLAFLEAWRGGLSAGERLGLRTIALADELGLDGTPLAAARLALALVAYDRGQVDRAANLLDEIAEELGEHPRPVFAAWMAIERARLALATGEAAAGLAVLSREHWTSHPSMPAAILARRCAVEAELLIMLGELEAAEQVLAQAPLGSSEVIVAQLRMAVELGGTASAHALLARFPDEPEPRASLERRLWVAILHHLDGNEATAAAGMADVVADAEVEGNLEIFRAAGQFALRPARALYRVAPSSFLRMVVDRPVMTGRPKPVKELVEQLTERECIVLALLPTRLSNAEIAEQLGVSLNTIKTHLKHVYRKFDVVGRTEAVDAAERLHLL